MKRETPSSNLLAAGIMLAVFTTGLILGEGDRERRIGIRLVADTRLCANDMWKVHMTKIIRDVNRRFRSKFKITFTIRATSSWDPDPRLMELADLMGDLVDRVPKEDCQILIGLVAPGVSPKPPYGAADYLNAYILLKAPASLSSLAGVLEHELCHIFGAVDLDEKGSIMSFARRGHRFDSFTDKIMALNRNRSFHPHQFPLPPSELWAAVDLYRDRFRLRRNEPELPLVLAHLFFQITIQTGDWAGIGKKIGLGREAGQVFLLLGNLCLKNGLTDPAVECYRGALKYIPDSPELHFNLGLALSRKNRLEEAAECYRKALDFRPNDRRTLAALGRLYTNQGRIDPARKTFLRLLRIDPDSYAGLTNLAALLVGCIQARKNGHPAIASGMENPDPKWLEEAIRLCNRAWPSRPDRPEAFNILGVAFALRGHDNEAEAAFQTALRVDPGYFKARFNLGILSFRRNRNGKAAFHFQNPLEPGDEFGPALKMVETLAFIASGTFLPRTLPIFFIPKDYQIADWERSHPGILR